jgi:hypothetical protein
VRTATVERWLTSTITVNTPAGVDAYGQAATVTSATASARVVHSMKRARTLTGEEFTSTTQVITLHPITLADTLTIDGAERSVRAIERAQGLLGGGATLTVAML